MERQGSSLLIVVTKCNNAKNQLQSKPSPLIEADFINWRVKSMARRRRWMACSSRVRSQKKKSSNWVNLHRNSRNSTPTRCWCRRFHGRKIKEILNKETKRRCVRLVAGMPAYAFLYSFAYITELKKAEFLLEFRITFYSFLRSPLWLANPWSDVNNFIFISIYRKLCIAVQVIFLIPSAKVQTCNLIVVCCAGWVGEMFSCTISYLRISPPFVPFALPL